MSDNIEYFINRKIILKEVAKQMSTLELAFIGDSVFELFVKNVLVQKQAKVKTLTVKANSLVNAKAQQKVYFRIQDLLVEDEKDIIMRGRNSHINTKAKNFSIEEYRHATALESLIGYLYLTGQDERLKLIFNKMDVFGDIK